MAPPSRPARLLRSMALLGASLALAACTPSLTTPSPTTAQPAASTSPAPLVVLPLDLCAGTGADCALDPGQYVARDFLPPVGFTLADDGWTNTAYVDRAIQLLRGDSASLAIVSGELDGPTASAPAATASGAPGPAGGTTAADFLAYLHTLSGLGVSGPTALQIGGLSATQVDLHVGSASLTLFNQPLTSDTEDPFDLGAGETLRLWVVDVAGARVVFIAEAQGSASLPDFETAEVQPLIASVTFPPSP